MKQLEKFFYMVRMVFLEKLAYTKALWFDIMATLVYIVIYYFLWQIVFRSQNQLAGFSMMEMTTYIILSRTLAAQFSGGVNRQFAVWIYEGAIGTELQRPVGIFTNLLSRRVGEFLFYLLFKAAPVLLVSFLFLRGTGPAGAENVILFFVSVVLSVWMMFYIEMIVGMGSFYTLTHYALGYIKTALLDLLSGSVVPLALFPAAMGTVLQVLPFAGMVSVPINIFLGKYSIRQTFFYLLLQCIWTAVMYLLAHGCYGKVIKKVVVQGG